ncbi:hypothetical protein [Planotetraspora kaengkrachanensis]|nr:hypothetical protein [Planotetraspora kaengkrachanensis]
MFPGNGMAPLWHLWQRSSASVRVLLAEERVGGAPAVSVRSLAVP